MREITLLSERIIFKKKLKIFLKNKKNKKNLKKIKKTTKANNFFKNIKIKLKKIKEKELN
jgi:hypothetical protein